MFIKYTKIYIVKKHPIYNKRYHRLNHLPGKEETETSEREMSMLHNNNQKIYAC